VQNGQIYHIRVSYARPAREGPNKFVYVWGLIKVAGSKCVQTPTVVMRGYYDIECASWGGITILEEGRSHALSVYIHGLHSQ